MRSQTEFPTAILTGGTGAIGEAIATGLAELGYSLFLIVRNPQKASAAIERISNLTGNKKITYLSADISRQSEIERLAASWTRPLNVLINNAAIAPVNREETAEGIELQFATNVLGYYWMIETFSNFMTASPGSRIVNVASYWAGDLALDDLEFKTRPYHNHTAYRQSKQANRMLTPVFAEKLKPHGITVNACHPGDVNSSLSNALGFGGSQPPRQGADTPLWLAASQEVEGITGKYFERRKEVSCPFAADRKASHELYNICNTYTKGK